MRKLLVFSLLAIAGAAFIAFYFTPTSYHRQLIEIQARDNLGYLYPALGDQSITMKSYLLFYQESDQELLLNAWLGILLYPEFSHNAIEIYGAQKEFQVILKQYGIRIFPVIHYFYVNDPWSVRAIQSTTTKIKSVSGKVFKFINEMTGQPVEKTVAGNDKENWGARDRGWYAINRIASEGHDFLGQFVVTTSQEVKWLVTERVFEATTSFFGSGIRNLEIKHDLDQALTASDWFWAGVDVSLVISALKLARVGKLVTSSGKELNLVQKTGLFGSRLLRQMPWLSTIGKYGAVAGVAYILIQHPSLINSSFAEVAKLVGIETWQMQLLGWTVIIIIVLYVLSWLLYPLMRFLNWSFKLLSPVSKKGYQES